MAAAASLLRSPMRPVVAISAALLVLAYAVWMLPPTRRPVPGADPWLPWWALLLAVIACELIVVHLQVRREAQAVSLSELAIVLALFYGSPGGFLLARAIGSALVYAVWRRQSPIKVLFNWSVCIAETCLALLVFHALAGPGVNPRAWLAACAATAVVGGLAGLVVTVAVDLVEGGFQLRDLVTEPGRAAATSLVVTVPALVAVHALDSDRLAVVPMGVCFPLAMLGYRAYGALSERHLTLGRLYGFTHVVGRAQGVDQVLHRVLEQAQEVLRAEYAEITFTPVPGRHPVRISMDGDGRPEREPLPAHAAADPLRRAVLDGWEPVLMPRGARDDARRRFLRERGLRDAILVPLRAEADIIGTLLVGDRLGEVRSFDDEDARLLSTVANHAGIAVQNGQLIDRLRHDALHDGLTGLPNRTLLNRRLAELTDQLRDGELAGLAVVILDLVGFKQVNDTLGHEIGDQVLQDTATRLAAATGAADLVARLSGDEFAVLLQGVDTAPAALREGRRLAAALTRPIRVDGIGIEVGASIGMCLAPLHGNAPRILLTRADAAMHEARNAGAGVHLYEPGLETTISPQRLALAGELRRAIEAGRLEVYVQPLASLRTGAVVGVEALVRWDHPRHGMLPPEDFVGLAERTGLIGPLTDAVLAAAITECGRWRRLGYGLLVAVNLSARSILDTELSDRVSRLLVRHRVPPQALTLEITESSVVGRPARALAVLGRLRDLGVRLALDDFGTGYSPLSYLRELPVQEVKIDKSFVSRMLDEDSDAAIVRSVIDLAGSLGLEVVAEGVEDRVTWDTLAAMGADLVQGYLLAAPMAMPRFETWLHACEARPVPGQPGAEPVPSSGTRWAPA